MIFINERNRLNQTGIIAIIGAVIAAVVLRVLLFNFKSGDFIGCLSGWYDYIYTNGGFAALKYQVGDYNSTYLYLMTLLTYLPIPKLYSIKILSCLFDFIAAGVVFKIISLKYPGTKIPFVAGMVLLATPTIVMNSALWAQSDMTYTSAILASIYCLMRRHTGFSFFFFGIALAFKLQAVFLLPLYLILILRKEASFYHLFIIPLVYVASVTPSWLLGRPFKGLLLTYVNQVHSYNSLSLWAPNIYQWFIKGDFDFFYKSGLIVTFIAVGAVALLFLKAREFTKEVIVSAALSFALVVPFFLPKMHERYFFMADVLSVVYAVYFPKYWYVPVFVVGASSLSYLPFLFQICPVDMRIVSVMIFSAMVLVAYQSNQLIKNREIKSK